MMLAVFLLALLALGLLVERRFRTGKPWHDQELRRLSRIVASGREPALARHAALERLIGLASGGEKET
jgi:hypothetical protein